MREAADASPAARQPPHGGAQIREVGGPGGGNSPRADAEAGGGAQQQPAQFSCDFGCGFHGGFDAVQEHEQACRLRPWSSPATTDDAQMAARRAPVLCVCVCVCVCVHVYVRARTYATSVRAERTKSRARGHASSLMGGAVRGCWVG